MKRKSNSLKKEENNNDGRNDDSSPGSDDSTSGRPNEQGSARREILSSRTSPSSPTPRPPSPGHRSMRLVDPDLEKPSNIARQGTDGTECTMSTAGSTHLTLVHSNSLASQSQIPRTPRRSTNRTSKRRPSRQLYSRQIQVLTSVSGISLLLFLFFFLNMFAFAALISTLSSLTMLSYTSYTYLMYLITSDDVNFFELLPESVQQYLSETTVHSALTDSSSFLENRFFLLYFIPGLSEEQVMGMVNRLPARHRDLLLGPGGMARMLLPENAWRMIDPNGPQRNATTLNVQNINSVDSLEEEGVGTLGLPIIRESADEDNFDVEESEQEEVTIQDAVQGLAHTAASLLFGRGNEDQEEEHTITYNSSEDDLYEERVADEVSNIAVDPSNLNDLNWIDDQRRNTNANHSIGSEDDDSDIGIDITPDAFTGHMSEGRLTRLARVLRLPISSPIEESSAMVTISSTPPTTVTTRRPVTLSRPTQGTDSTTPNNEELVVEQNLEEQILSEAVSTMISNYSSAAAQSLTGLAHFAVEAAAPTIIRTGLTISSLSGAGLLGYISSRSGTTSPGDIIFGGRQRSAPQGGERYVITGLFSTFFVGIASVGTAYFMRNRARAYLTSERIKAAEEKSEEEREKDKHI